MKTRRSTTPWPALNQVAKDLQGFTADLETSDGLLPRLVNDEEYGREITGKLQRDRRTA